MTALILSMLVAAAQAEDEPLPAEGEELVVVSATVAEERSDPASFSDFSAEQILTVNAGQDMSTLFGETMNAYSYSDAGNGYGYSYLRIRGFDQTRIAVNINGVPLNTPESHQVYSIDLGDFATGLGLVQIQRGPGTALYGSPAVGGVVNLETARIPAVKGGALALSVSSFGTSRISFGYGGAIGTSPWAYFVRAAHVESDGYRKPSWSRQTLLHVGFERLAPESVWRIMLFGGPETTQLSYLGVPKEYLDDDALRRTNFLLPGETDTFVQPQLQVMNDRRLAHGLFLKNTVYGILGDGYFRQYAASLAYNPQGNPVPDATIDNAWMKRALGNGQIGWIPRLSYAHKGGELTAGLELLFHRGRHDGKVTGDGVTTPLVLYDFKNGKDTVNLFVREAIAIAKGATLNLELQATRHEFTMRDDTVRGISWDGEYSFLTPRLGANWNLSDRWNVYGQVTRTESEPTFTNVWNPENTLTDPADYFRGYDASKNRYSDPHAKPERLTSFEAGAGYVSGATRIKLNLYRMQFHDEFVFAGARDADGMPVTTNAGKSLHQGIEFEARGRIPGEVDLSGYVAVSDDVLEQHSVVASDGASGSTVIDYSGNRVGLFPSHTARLAVARTFGLARVELSARNTGRIYLDNSENERKTPANRTVPGYVDKEIDPYTVVAAQAVFDLSRASRRPAGGLTLRVRCDNLLDANIAQFGYAYPDPTYTTFYSEFFPGAGRSFVAGLDFAF